MHKYIVCAVHRENKENSQNGVQSGTVSKLFWICCYGPKFE